MISRIDHVAIAVQDFAAARDFFAKIMDIVPGASATEHSLGFFWQVFSAGDLSRLELLAPTGEKSFLSSFLKDKDGGVHHITCQTEDIEEARKELERENIPYFGYNPENEAWKELFIHPRDAFGVLIQIAEFSPEQYLDASQNLPEKRKWLITNDPDGCRLSIAHPGGGTAEIQLDRAEMKRLLDDLEKSLI